LNGLLAELWAGFPFDIRLGEAPRETDSKPERNQAGQFILYHGTSREGARRIRREKMIRPDGLNAVGLATSAFGARTYAAMKGGPVLQVTVDPLELAGLDAGHEIGGSGRDQFLLRSGHHFGAWPGVRVGEVEVYRERTREV
jgi:hypothetical protein